MTTGALGVIVTPAQGNRIPPGAAVIADNGCFGSSYVGDERWWAWLTRLPAARVRFAVAPDVVGDARATLTRSSPWLPAIRALGLPAAFVAQDGLEHLTVPWESFDVLFIGGSTEWKLGPAARALVGVATARGVPVHMGRVNSWRRLRYAHAIGCSSADGTYLTFGPDVLLPRLLRFLGEVNTQGALFTGR
jgi:hypothetical protein